MVKFYENSFSYDYTWPTVFLAYFLRYPNPYSTHVISTDTLASHLDPATGNLHLTRLHLKRGKLPAALARFLPKIKESFILERSIVDVRNHRLSTETRNLNWDGVLSVVESQVYERGDEDRTDVQTVVKFESKFGGGAEKKDEDERKSGFFSGWGAGSVQRSIELVGKSKTRDALTRSREGIKVVLEQLRERGFRDVVQEQRQGAWERWKKTWKGEGLEEL